LQAGWRAARLGLLVDARDVAQAMISSSAGRRQIGMICCR
jgi:hypothetical protein